MALAAVRLATRTAWGQGENGFEVTETLVDPAFRNPAAQGRGKAAGHPSSESVKAAPPGGSDLARQAEEKVKKLGELHRHRRGVEASIERLRRELAAIFDAAATDALDLPTGRLRRLPRAEGEGWDFVVEV